MEPVECLDSLKKNECVCTTYHESTGYLQLSSFFVRVAASARFTTALPALKTTDFLQNREIAGWPLVAIIQTTVVMATARENAVRAGAPLDLSKGVLQAGQWVFSVLVSVVPGLVLSSG